MRAHIKKMAVVINRFRMLEIYFETCPSYRPDQLLDNIMVAFNWVPFFAWLYLLAVSYVDRYIYGFFIVNGTFLVWLLQAVLEGVLPLDTWNDGIWPLCSIKKNSHIDGDVAVLVFIVTFVLSVKYRKTRLYGDETRLSWTWDTFKCLFIVAGTISADLYLRQFNVYDILIGVTLGAIMGWILAWLLINVVREYMDSRAMALFCRVTSKQTDRIAHSWPPAAVSPQSYAPVPHFHSSKK